MPMEALKKKKRKESRNVEKTRVLIILGTPRRFKARPPMKPAKNVDKTRCFNTASECYALDREEDKRKNPKMRP